MPDWFALAGWFPCVHGLAVSASYIGAKGPRLVFHIPDGKYGCEPKPTVRLVPAVPTGTPGRSRGSRLGPEKYTTLRALVSATSIEKIGESGMRYSARILPSRSDTAITMRARVPSGSRICARVRLAVSMALCTIAVTSATLRVALAEGPTSQPSGAGAPLSGPTW